MKKLLTLALWAAVLVPAAAQDVTGPTTTWPYLYPMFRPGTIVMEEGKTKAYEMNIHLRHDALHYLDQNGNVQEAFLTNVRGAEIDGDRYLNINGAMLKVEATSDKGCVVAEILGDFALVHETGGAYGSSSSTSATRKLSSIDTDNQINQHHMLLFQHKDSGQDLPLLTHYYLVYEGNTFPCGGAAVFQGALPSPKKAAWKDWKKSHKIKWNNPGSLVQLLDFLAE